MKRKPHHHSTAEERIHAFNYMEQGKTEREAAKLCGVSLGTIKTWKRQLKLRGQSYLKPKKRHIKAPGFELCPHADTICE